MDAKDKLSKVLTERRLALGLSREMIAKQHPLLCVRTYERWERRGNIPSHQWTDELFKIGWIDKELHDELYKELSNKMSRKNFKKGELNGC